MPNRKQSIPSFVASTVVGMAMFGAAGAQDSSSIVTPDDARSHGLESLRTIVENEGVPLPPNLQVYVKNSTAARVLGKALFHDMAVGSDGIQACATCHFNAGADSRWKNQLSPGLLRVKDQREGDVKGFFNAEADPDTNFEVATPGPNHIFDRADFPFVRDIGSDSKKGGKKNGANVNIENGTVTPVIEDGNSNDVASSMGVFLTYFERVIAGALKDEGTPIEDNVFNVEGVNTRRVEPRNTPTTINAVFNFANFWDGRANNRFNGVNPFGKQDKGAVIYMSGGESIVAVPLNLKNASLASQAVGPPLSHFEMSFGNGVDNFRSMPEVGRKLLTRHALEGQRVHEHDSLLASRRDGSGYGLTSTYKELIEEAFNDKFWSDGKCLKLVSAMYPASGNQSTVSHGRVEEVDCSQPGAFSLTEANFAFFYGISVMLYEATLVSDMSPFDNWMRTGYDEGFGEAELRGLNVFVGKGKCANCHGGPELTNASVRNAQGGNNVIEPMLMGNRQAAMYDNGYYNIGVTPTQDDLGRGAPDPFGAPLSWSRQFAFDALGIQDINFPIEGAPIPNLHCSPDDSNHDGDASTCDDGLLGFHDEDFGLGFFPVCRDLDSDGKCGVSDELLLQRVAVDGAFKTPGLRNIAETPPYMHNGGLATLREVVQFYNRGGNFCRTNQQDLDPDIRGLGLTLGEEEDLVKFMIALTDPRVVRRAAPFDAPGFAIPNGHPESWEGQLQLGDDPRQAADDLLYIDAVGKDGGEPLFRFLGVANNDDAHLEWHLHANRVSGGVCSPGDKKKGGGQKR